MLTEKLREYARLQLQLGAALQPGQILYLSDMPVSQRDYVDILIEEAFALGAADVALTWNDPVLDRMRAMHTEEAELNTWYGLSRQTEDHLLERGACELSFYGQAPHAYDGCSAGRLNLLSALNRSRRKERILAHIQGRIRCCTSAIPTPDWAREVFPELPEQEAVEAMWEMVLLAAKVTGDGQSAQRWLQLKEQSQRRCDILNAAKLKTLHYRSSLGTDVTIGLPEKVIWHGPGDTDTAGIAYFGNLPTEEIYTSPDCRVAEGTVVSSMPVYWQGSVIRGIHLQFRAGTAVEAWAEEGDAILQSLLSTDENALRLGECALVGWDSPIRRCGRGFCNMLYDENASCHFALGQGFPTAVPEGTDPAAAGVNQSAMHLDFMVGTEDLEITGIRVDGTEMPVMRKGLLQF